MTNFISVENGSRFKICVSESKLIFDIDIYEESSLFGKTRVASLSMSEAEFKSLFYKMKAFMEKEFFNKQNKGGDDLCIIAKVKKTQLQVTPVATMAKFLHCMTDSETGDLLSILNTDSSSADIGDTTGNTTTSDKENG